MRSSLAKPPLELIAPLMEPRGRALGRRCTVCSHPRRDAIDEVLVSRATSYRNVAKRYRLTKDALYRHYAEHLPKALTQAQGAREVAAADDLLDQVRTLQTRALTILGRAEAAGDLRTTLGAIREARGNLELLAKLLGELNEAPTVNVLVTTEWQQVQGTMLRALAPYPEARVRVADAIAALATRNGHAAGV